MDKQRKAQRNMAEVSRQAQPKAVSGLKNRMEDFYFEVTTPDGKTTKIGSQQKGRSGGGGR